MESTAEVGVVAAGAVVAVGADGEGVTMMTMRIATVVCMAMAAVAFAPSPIAQAEQGVSEDRTAKSPASSPANSATASTATVFASPEAAASALRAAVETRDPRHVDQVLGQGSAAAIFTGDPAADEEMRARFLKGYKEGISIEREADGEMTLLIGSRKAEFPYPLVQASGGWRFDGQAGAEEIVNRRIGQNELMAIKACLAYGDAQREYAESDRDGDGVIEYAQRFRSTPGQHDGLYWPTAANEPESPLGPLLSDASPQQLASADAKPISFYGYHYRILTAQGPAAEGGAYDYLVNGNLIGGFALVAYPAVWGKTGVMTFSCNHSGVVYQKNQGADSAKAAMAMTVFDPGKGWQRAE